MTSNLISTTLFRTYCAGRFTTGRAYSRIGCHGSKSGATMAQYQSHADVNMGVGDRLQYLPEGNRAVLDKQAAVLENAVIGVPNAERSRPVIGILEPEHEQTLDIPAIMQTLGRMHARFTQPCQRAVVDELPSNTLGKIQKKIRRGRFAEGL